MAKLKVDLTISNAELATSKKEVKRLVGAASRYEIDIKALRSELEVLFDEVQRVNKQNNTYRSLMLEHENKMNEMQMKVIELQNKIRATEKYAHTYKN